MSKLCEIVEELIIDTGSDFSGVGTFDQALQMLGIKQNKIFACDMDKHVRQTYELNYGKPVYYPEDVNERIIPKKPLFVYMTSPPCQGFSLAGLREGSILFFNSHNFIKVNKPRYFVFENVKGLLSHDKRDKNSKHGYTFSQWLAYLGGKSVNGNPTFFPHEESVPYHIYYMVLNAKNYGIPQNRERVFIVGIRDDEDNDFTFPKGFPLLKRLKDVLEPEVDEKYYLPNEVIEGFLAKIDKANIDNDSLGIDYSEDKGIIMEGFISKDTQGQRVYDSSGIFPTISACSHGYALGYITEVQSAAIRGRDVNNPKSRVKSENYSQMLEINENPEIVNTITTVEKDNVIVETHYKTIGYTRDSKGEVVSRHLNDIANTIHTATGGGGNTDQFIQESIYIKTNNEKGFEILNEGDSLNLQNPNSETRRGRVGKQVAQTLDTKCEQAVYLPKPELDLLFSLDEKNSQATRVYNPEGISCTLVGEGGGQGAKTGLYLLNKRIRRLTPRECFRLMGFPDSFIWNVSDTQAYRQAGNAIVVDVLAGILSKLILKK